MGSILSFLKKKTVRTKTSKVSFIRKYKIKFSKTFLIIKSNKELGKFLEDMFELGFNGLLGNLILIPFGLKLNILIILSIGSGIFLFSKKILPLIIQLISSFGLVKVVSRGGIN